MKQFKIITFIITLLSFTTSVAQTNYFSKFSEANRWSAGIQLSPNFAYNDAENIKIGFGGGVHAKYSFGQSFGLNFNADLLLLNLSVMYFAPTLFILFRVSTKLVLLPESKL